MTLKLTGSTRDDLVKYALIDISPEKLESAGIQFAEPPQDGTWSEAGPIEECPVTLPSGVELLLVVHGHDPSLGIDVRAPVAVRGPSVANELIKELGVPASSLRWLRGNDDE